MQHNAICWICDQICTEVILNQGSLFYAYTSNAPSCTLSLGHISIVRNPFHTTWLFRKRCVAANQSLERILCVRWNAFTSRFVKLHLTNSCVSEFEKLKSPFRYAKRISAIMTTCCTVHLRPNIFCIRYTLIYSLARCCLVFTVLKAFAIILPLLKHLVPQHDFHIHPPARNISC